MNRQCDQKGKDSGKKSLSVYDSAFPLIAALALLVAVVLFSVPALAQESPSGSQKELSADEVAKQLANPNNSLASLTFKNQYRWYTGDLPDADHQDNYTLLFQPVFPFRLKPTASGGVVNLFVRPAFPILVGQPVPEVSGWDKVSALGDIGFDIGYGVTEKSGLLWAFGMVGTLPIATDSKVAGKQLRLGPEALIAKFEKWGLYGIFPSQQWDVAGWADKSYSNTQIQICYVSVIPDPSQPFRCGFHIFISIYHLCSIRGSSF